MLVVLGVRSSSIRLVQLVQLAVPLLLALLAALMVGQLGGNAALRIGDLDREWYAGTLLAMAPLVLLAVTTAALVGWVIVGNRLRAEDLRKE